MQAQAVAERAIEDAEAGNASREFLTFVLGEEEYGVDILKVQEIRGYDTVTRIPEAPEFLKGVVNLRGTIVPVIDLRLKFHLPRADYDAFTVMIVLNLAERVVGVVVDRVSDVMALGSDQIFDPPEFGSTVDTAFITGLGSVEDRMLILLDIAGLMRSREMQLIDHAIQQ